MIDIVKTKETKLLNGNKIPKFSETSYYYCANFISLICSLDSDFS